MWAAFVSDKLTSGIACWSGDSQCPEVSPGRLSLSSTAIYNFQGNGAPQLSLQIGDLVRIQETCGGESLGGQDACLMVFGSPQHTLSTFSPLFKSEIVCDLFKYILLILVIAITKNNTLLF